MWMKWLPWRFIVRRMARAQGFLDPISLLSSLQRFAQPSEVMAPTELLRAGAVLQARGLMNSQAIQHNLDWIWPYWVERQFDPKDDAFVPRAFNITHINLTHRNWTAVGVPDSEEMPIVDPRGLVTPFLDGWSLDAWVIDGKGGALLPSQRLAAEQVLDLDGALAVVTRTDLEGMALCSRAEVVRENGAPVLRITLDGGADAGGWLVVSLRPYNPEGVSFVHKLGILENKAGWKVNGKQTVFFSERPVHLASSYYRAGDVYRRLFDEKATPEDCHVGMLTAAALFRLSAAPRRVTVRVPLAEAKKSDALAPTWSESLRGLCRLHVPDARMQFLFDAAVRTLVLHSPGDVYPGPYTYKRFWFRDAAFILHAMVCVGLASRAERALDRFPSRQTPFGYFLSQEGEWDSNGEALWILRRYCELTGKPPKPAWAVSIRRAGRWIARKRLSEKKESLHAGLLPAGFSAEHLGPNDYYYWDNYWGVAGLQAAAWLCDAYGDHAEAALFRGEAERHSVALEKSVLAASARLGTDVIPASPYRRLDAGAIGSLAGSYPLLLYSPDDARAKATADFLAREFFVDGGFFQEISHSGVNPYLTLHVAQVFLRAGDRRFFKIMKSVAEAATSTGQWPEAIHPRTRGGCMGDGQHVWAAAEWTLMLRNVFVREEGGALVLASGICPEWSAGSEPLFLENAPTDFGNVSVRVSPSSDAVRVEWQGRWRGAEPKIQVRLPGFVPFDAAAGQASAEFQRAEVRR